MLVSLSIETEGISASISMLPITLITGPPGSGKSRLLSAIASILSSIESDIRPLGFVGRVKMVIEAKPPDELVGRFNELNIGPLGNRFEYIFEVDSGHITHVIKSNEATLMVVRGDGEHGQLAQPITLNVSNPWKILSIDIVKPRDDAEVLLGRSGEVSEALMRLVGFIRGSLGIGKVYVMGPYFSFEPFEKGLGPIAGVGKFGEGTVGALAEAFTDPGKVNQVNVLRKALAKLGIRGLKVGPLGGALRLVYRDARGWRVLEKPPCHLSTILAVAAQLMYMNRGDVLVVENLDYCMRRESWDVLVNVLQGLSKDKYIIAEVHNDELIKGVPTGNVFSILTL